MDVNYLAVILAALSAFFLGFLWYTVIFTKPWQKELRMKTDPKGAQAPNLGHLLIVSFILELVMAFNLSMFIGKEGTHFGLLAGLATGFGWVSLAFGVNYLFEGRSFKHWIINAGYNTVVFGVMGLIIGAMQAAPQIVTTETLAENETLSKPDIAIPSEINSYTKSEIWIVTDASEYEIRYRPIEWYTDEQAQLEAEKDGERTPGGFYWRYKDDETTPRIWPVTNPLQIRTELLCQNAICLKGTDGYANVTLSFDGYLNATIACEANQEQCFYYGIGSGMDFFDVTISKDNEILSLKSRYVP